ncbi:MAG: hypothetical protein ACYC2G_15535 [Gemmatimonadaceae bacterium]
MTTHTTPRSFHVVAALVVVLVAGGCSADSSDGRMADSAAAVTAVTASSDDASAESGVRSAVASFASRMETVSVLGPDSLARAQLREAYGVLVAPELLEQWMARPEIAPGRRVSSPWPDSIQMRSLQPAGPDSFEVSGDLVYASSADDPPAGAGAVTTPVRLTVTRSPEGAWRIASYSEGAGGVDGPRRAGGSEGADSATDLRGAQPAVGADSTRGADGGRPAGPRRD